MEKRRYVRVESADPQRLDVYLAGATELSRSQVQKLIESGKVKINDKVADSSNDKIRDKDLIEFLVELPKDFTIKEADIPLDIIYEDEYLLAINKQPGLVVHPAPGHYEDTLVNALINKHFKEEDFVGNGARLGIVHRLDRDTSGVMVIARNSESHGKLAEMFKQRQLTKVYNCFVHGQLDEGYISTNIGRAANNRKKFAAKLYGGKEAHTLFAPIEKFSPCTFLRIEILTGRTHQIRVHMNHIKHPVVGDEMYGNKGLDCVLAEYLGYSKHNYKPLMPRQMLHAAGLRFIHPFTGKEMIFEAKLPEDFTRLLELLRKKREMER